MVTVVMGQYRRGRPLGSRNRASLMVEQLLEERAQALGEKAIEMALAARARIRAWARPRRPCYERKRGRLRNRVEWLGKRLPPRRPVVVEWFNPETGRWWMRITLSPTRNGRGISSRTQVRKCW